MQFQSLAWEDPLEKEMTIHSSILAWGIPWIEKPGRLWSIGSQTVGHYWNYLARMHAAFFMVQLSHPYMTTGKITALTIWTFVGKLRSPLFNMLTRFVMDFLPRSKCLFISWLQSLSTGILEPKKIKSVTTSNFSPLDLVQMTISSIKSWEIYFKLPLLLFLSFFPLHWQKFFFSIYSFLIYCFQLYWKVITK